MTRETKVGLVVATTFLCLVSLVIASKLRGPEAEGAGVAEARQIEPGTPDPTRGDVFEPSEEPNPDKPIAPAPSPALPKVPPSLNIPTKTSVDPLPRAMPQPPAPAPAAPAIGLPGPVVELPELNPTPPAPASAGRGWWGRYTQPSEVPVSAPVADVHGNQGAAAGEQGAGSQSPIKVAQVEDPIKLPPVSPVVPAPVSDPIMPIPTPTPKGTATPTVPAPAPSAAPAPGAPTPIVLPAPPGMEEPKKERAVAPSLPTPTPTGGIPAGPLGGPVAPAPAPAQPKQMPPADPPAPTAVQEPTSALPSGPAAPRAGTIAPPKHIGTIGLAGNDASVTPPVAPALPHAAVPALPAAGADLPKVIGHSDAVHRIEPGQTTFAQLSERWYGSDKYAQALLEYNRQHLLNRANTDLRRDPPVLQANQAIYYPAHDVLESTFAALIKAPVPAAPAAPSSGPPVVQISPPTPLAGPSAGGTADATVAYRVPQADHILRIAQQTLGSMDAWREIVRLNPSLRTDLPIPAGTVLRLPAKARVN
jgi:hypothetical protein